jgi:hypothetical protein
VGLCLCGDLWAREIRLAVVPVEVQAEKSGNLFVVSGRLTVTNHAEDTVFGLMAESDSFIMPIGDIPPHGEITSPSFTIVFDTTLSPYVHFIYPVTLKYFDGQELVSVSAGIPCAVPMDGEENSGTAP